MKKIIFTILCSLFFCISGNAQTEIKGTVKDASGFPLPLATIKIIGTNIGTTSDLDGNFLITSKKNGSKTIEVSNLGFDIYTKTISLTGTRILLDVILKGGVSNLQEVVLTASTTFRSQKEAPMSISSVKASEITKLSANSQADILRSVPGITAEGGGGEVAANVFVRGLPSGGQYVFNPLQYDGMPLISAFGLNSSAHDVYARTDIGFKGVEFVRGGSAILYGAGSVAGIINYTSKTGDTDPGNIVNIEWANGGRLKTDFYSGGKLGGDDSSTYYALSGFVRYDEGPIDTGLATRGVQLRGNVKKKFDNGSFTMHGQFIDDNVQFYTGIPLNGNSRERLTGNDGKEVEQLISSQLSNTSFLTPNGNYTSPLGNGVATKGGYFLGDFKYKFENDLKFRAKARYAKYQHSFALLGGTGSPITLDNYVNGLDAANTGYVAKYQGGNPNNTITGDTRVSVNTHTDRIRPMTDYAGEASLTKKIDADDVEHNVTIGTFLSRTEAEDVNFGFSYLSEFNNDPRLVNLSYTDGGGNNVIASEGGLTNRAGKKAERYLSQNRAAFYISDEIVLDDWRIDVGFRYESTDGIFNNGNIVSSKVYDNPELTPELANVGGSDGTFTRGKVNASDWAASFALLYNLTDNVNLYANASKGFFFPQLRSFAPVPGVSNTPYDSEKIYQVELGTKLSWDKLSGSAAIYYVALNDRVSLRQNTSFIDEFRDTQDTETYGLEFNGDYEVVENLHLKGGATYQIHEIAKNQREYLITGVPATSEFVGNKLQRQPNFIGSLGLHYDNNTFDSSFTLNHTGSKFNANDNLVELDAITIARINGGYTFDMEDDKTLRLGVSIFNLFDSDGVTEGNPRGASVSGNFFSGRPILPRRFFLTASFNF